MDEEMIKESFERLKPFLDEKLKRLYVANLALSAGWGGIGELNKVTGLSRDTIRRGMVELREGVCEGAGNGENGEEIRERARQRARGGGRKSIEVSNSGIGRDLEQLLEPVTRGDTESPLLWTSKSLRRLAAELGEKGHKVSHETVRRLLLEMGYSLQADFKTIEKGQHADRDEQFEYLYASVKDAQERDQPVISVDTKKKELVGNFKNGGKEWHLSKNPVEVSGHDFEDKALGKAIPFGVYDLSGNEGWVSVGIDHDTSQFAVSSIRNWWLEMGRHAYPCARELTITADSGGSNGSKRRMWKTELQRFANETGMTLHVLHYPPGTSKWNKIEHRMFSFISKNW
ncbi:MAG: ISAzo13 family transposase, partial [Zoogloeaceae bacterium]|nr:ISAzo13 family transposase [Zoogloeaceae bacterium]